MANLLTRLWRREPEISRSAVDDYLSWVRQAQLGFGGYMGGFVNPAVTLSGKRPAERVENSFAGYINGAFKVNPIVFGIMAKRAAVLSEARFAWREKVAGKPGELYYDDALGVLERPWPNGTTGELLSRMIQDVDLAGNFYAVNEGDRLRRLRPDWVQIVLTGNPLLDLDVDVLGYLYTAGGPDSGGESKAYRPSEICHWSPQPDPDALYRGMSWVTPVIREIQGDQAAVEHKLSFFRNGATLGPIIKAPPGLTVSQFTDFVEAAEAAHRGALHAYKTMYLAGGSDVTLAAANMQQLEFTAMQGKAETRMCVAASIPAAIAGVSEGLHGSSLNAGNYGTAKREWADTWLRPTWRSACAALSTIVAVPDDADLWYDECDITFLHDDRQDAANIAQTQMATINTAITAGFEPDAAVITVQPAWKDTMKHTGMFSVQLQQPGQGTPPPGGAAAGAPAELPPVPPGFEPDATVRALQTTLDLVRATQSSGGGQSAAYNDLHPHVASGPTGGQFAPKGSGIGDMPPPSPRSGGSRPASATSSPAGTPQPPAEPRTMKPGDSGEDVRYAQYGLSLLGFNVAQSGTYDDATVTAVKQMQERLGVKKPNGHLTSAQLRQIQTAVRLSPCIGRSDKSLAEDMFDDIVRSFDLEDGEEDDEDAEDLEPYDSAPDPELDDESEPDEDTQALIAALSEVNEGVSRSFNEALHPRNPKGSVGGGRFRSIADRIVAALSDWKHGDGPDDPLKDFNRDQLLKAAKAHGHTFRRGASIEEIKAQILDDVRTGTKAEKAAAPHLPGAPADHRRFTIQHAGSATDVGIFAAPSTGRLSLYRESDTGKKQGRAIKSFDDMGQLEAWARDNGHTELADYAKAEQARTSGAKPTGRYRVISGTEANRWGRENFTPINDLPADQQTAIRHYAGGAHDSVNKYLRTGQVGPSNRQPVLDDIKGVDAIMAAHTVPEDVVVSRAGGKDMFGGEEPSAWVGRTLTEPAYMSTSLGDKPTGVQNRLGVHMTIEVPAGTRSYWVRGASEHTEERELLLDRGQKLEILSADYAPQSAKWKVRARVIPPAKAEQARTGGAAKVAKAAPAKAANRAAVKRAAGRDLTASIDAKTMADMSREDMFRDVLRRQGFDGKPTVTDSAGVDAVVRAGGTELFRGVGSAERADQFRHGEMLPQGQPVGASAFGQGLYAGDRPVAERYAGDLGSGSVNGGLIRMALNPDARVISKRELANIRAERSRNWNIDQQVAFNDDGRFAATLGYDAVSYGDGDKPNYLILNRTAVTVQDKDPRLTLAGLEGLTTVQRRAALRKRGLSKAEIDALAPLEKRPRTAKRSVEPEDDADPDLAEIEAWAEEDPADFDDEPEEAQRALGHDVTPGHDELHHYWTRGEGLAKWAESLKPWTTLVAHLTKYVGPLKAKIYASRWFIEVFGFAAGSDKNRVLHGQPPRGHRIGPG